MPAAHKNILLLIVRRFRSVKVVMFAICLPLAAIAHSESGLAFRSYETTQDERTFFCLTPRHDMDMGNYFSLDFEFRYPMGPRFGYMCRIIIGGSTSVDLLFSSPDEKNAELLVVYNNRTLNKTENVTHTDYSQWHRVKLEMLVARDKMTLCLDGDTLATKLDIPRKHNLNICFGVNKQPGFMTTDIPGFSIRNVSVSFAPGRTTHKWPLARHDNKGTVLDTLGGYAASVGHPQWLIDRHTAWKCIARRHYPAKSFMLFDAGSNLYVIQRNSIDMVPLSGQMSGRTYPFSPQLPIENLCDQFVFDRTDNSIVYYDFTLQNDSTAAARSRWTVGSDRWSEPVKKATKPLFWHHSAFFSPVDSSLFQLFGYGFHAYRSDMFRIGPGGGAAHTDLSGKISPRYLSATGIADSLLYIYGGIGNQIGNQEYGTKACKDLYCMDLRTMQIKELWQSGDIQDNEIAASTLLIDEGKILGLFYDPTKFSSYLILKEFSINDPGRKRILADTIPYNFLDIESEAKLCLSPSGDKLYAATMHRDGPAGREVNIYSISYPVLDPSQTAAYTAGRKFGFMLAISISLAAMFTGWYIYRVRFRKKRSQPTGEDGPEEDRQWRSAISHSSKKEFLPGIHLIGAFRVIDANGIDRASVFTPIMQQLLILIILRAYNGKGITSGELKDYLWFDKSDESARNNRNVNVHKIRTILETVGDYQISSDSKYITIACGGYCDYFSAMDLVDSLTTEEGLTDAQLDALLAVALQGQLLPEMQYEWLDGFKAGYADSMINLLARLRDAAVYGASPQKRILLSNTILEFDSLDESSIKAKCVALVAMGRIGMAKKSFEAFVREYRLVIGEDYSLSFERFIQK